MPIPEGNEGKVDLKERGRWRSGMAWEEMREWKLSPRVINEKTTFFKLSTLKLFCICTRVE